MGTLLLTGASGFTAGHLIPALVGAGYRVVGTGGRASGPDGLAAYHALDLCDGAAVRALVARVRPSYVVHLGGISYVGHGEALDFYRVNTLGSEHLLAALADLPCAPRRVLLASSAAVYGRNAQGCVSEATAAAPVNHYGLSKLAMEHVGGNFASVLPLVNMRLFNTTGPGQAETFLIPKLVAHFAARKARIALGNRAVSRDFSDIRDMVRAVVGLLEAPLSSAQSGLAVNLASGQAVALAAVLTMLGDLTGHRLTVDTDPALVRRDEIPALWGDTGRLQALTGWRREYELRDTLGWMLARA